MVALLLEIIYCGPESILFFLLVFLNQHYCLYILQSSCRYCISFLIISLLLWWDFHFPIILTHILKLRDRTLVHVPTLWPCSHSAHLGARPLPGWPSFKMQSRHFIHSARNQLLYLAIFAKCFRAYKVSKMYTLVDS